MTISNIIMLTTLVLCLFIILFCVVRLGTKNVCCWRGRLKYLFVMVAACASAFQPYYAHLCPSLGGFLLAVAVLVLMYGGTPAYKAYQKESSFKDTNIYYGECHDY